MAVHSALGPGLLESAYRKCLAHEFIKRGIPFVTEQPLPIVYDGLKLEAGYRMDFVVSGRLIVELKAVEALHELHQAQLITYLRFSGLHVGLIINFNVVHLRDGIKRMVLT